jgi:hypothetical protein
MSAILFPLFGLSVVMSGVIFWIYWRTIEKEKRLPLATELDGLDVRVALKREEYNEYRDRVDESRSVVEEANRLRKEIEGLNADVNRLQPMKDQLDRVNLELTAKHSELAQKVTALDELRAEHSETDGKLRSIKAEHTEAEEKFNLLKEDHRELETKKAAAEQFYNSQRIQAKQAQEDLEKILAKLSDEKSAVNELEKTRSELEAKVAGLRQEQQDYEARRKALEEQLKVFESTYQNTLKQLQKQWDDTLGEWKRSQDLTREQMKQQWETLQEHIKNAVEVINGTWNRLKPPEAAAEEEKYKELWNPVFAPNALKKPTSANFENEQIALQGVGQSLRESGLEFPERVIKSFHTCLKVNDSSPLTVLAGISGTGKSLLPKRYAEILGMRNLLVPVQPRWDSPQDLFGFYNYIESRYKATELSRAMVQMECFNRKDYWGDKDNDLHDQMLLVLLDEMNLARVEYYFSEFLSKLETRRDIDNPDNEDSRRNAELVFEMGALSEGEKPARVFPHNNILFVGTMNEDETTQSLSDKVVDRANVLRFGKPKSLAQSKENAAVPSGKRAGRALSYQEWNGWIQTATTLGNNDRNEIAKWTSHLNDALNKVQKPFGHRVSLAIEQYIANYPATGTIRLKHGFADQLEQRIMPKLRGLDPRDNKGGAHAFNEIEEIIKQLDDQPLLRAFRAGRDHDLFMWSGLDRTE